MPLIEYVIISLTILYLIEMIFFRLGLERAEAADKNYALEPSVSVIVAARNEEETIGRCIESLLQVDYPKEKLEIIIVNDRSTDRTAEVAQRYAQADGFVHVTTSPPEEGNLRGKANALAHGIGQSRGEILMFTDADCRVSRTWIREIVSSYGDGVGVVAGFTSLDTTNSFSGMQALDWFYVVSVAASAAAWNLPLTAVGNNLSVRRSAYEAVGGYKNVPFSVTEDYALVQSIWQQTGEAIRYTLSPGALVSSSPCNSWSELYRQRQRWGVGGLDMVARGLILMGVTFAMHLALLVGIFFVSPKLLFFSIAAKFAGDVLLLVKPLTVFRKKRLFRYFLTFELYFVVYELLLPFIALLSKKVVWKERAYRE